MNIVSFFNVKNRYLFVSRYDIERAMIHRRSSLKSHFTSVKTSRLSGRSATIDQGCGTRYRAELNIRRLNICTTPISTIQVFTHTLSLSFSLSSRLGLENVSREFDDTRAFNVLPETVCHARFPTLSRNKIGSPGVSLRDSCTRESGKRRRKRRGGTFREI